MNSTCEIYCLETVPPSYGWDKGLPKSTFIESIHTLEESVSSNAFGQEVYLGHAPYFTVMLSSLPQDTHPIYLTGIKRIIDFGDYYNSKSNVISIFDKEPAYASFCHTYIMPGTYTIRLSTIEYSQSVQRQSNVFAFGACLQKYCIDWTWGNINSFNNPTLANVTWATTKVGEVSAKKWKFEPCAEEWASGNGTYIQKTGLSNPRSNVSWQYYNFYSSALNRDNPNNTSTPWISTGFQKPDQLTWLQTSGPCLEQLAYQNSSLIWKWDYITLSGSNGRFGDDITWDETKLSSPKNIRWDYTSVVCDQPTLNYLLSTQMHVTVKEAFIKVIENPPEAFLKVGQISDTFDEVEEFRSGVPVRLSPRYVTCGSFPIEKIVWDLGDGSPLLTQRRWSPTLKLPFVYSGAIVEDFDDPRNYDVIYTYTRAPGTPTTYYPSITAYASSTGTSDSAATIVGPLKLEKLMDGNLRILQNELTDNGKVYIGEISNKTGQNIAVWRADK